MNLETVFRNPVEFVKIFFNFNPTPYQELLLNDDSRRIVVRWSRQSGKTTTLALSAIWFALTHARTTTLIVAPSLRQSMVMGDRVQDFLSSLPKKWFDFFIEKMQRTQILTRNLSHIVILPNSINLLRGYTAHRIQADEAAFFKDDRKVFNSVLYPMLSTTNGQLIASSTPWGKDSVYYKFCQSPNYSKHFVDYNEVLKAGLTTQLYIDEMKEELSLEEFQREYGAIFTEDEDSWLSQSLITSCIDPYLFNHDFFDEIQPFEGESWFMGVDFGKHVDFSVVSVVKYYADGTIRLIHIHKFPLETPYSEVIGYIKSLNERWNISFIYADVTGVGDYIVEDMLNSGINNLEGILFTQAQKEEMSNILRENMRKKLFLIPYEPAQTKNDINLMSELNAEKYKLAKTGHIQFFHADRTHDDVYQSIMLAVANAVKNKYTTPLLGFGNADLG